MRAAKQLYKQTDLLYEAMTVSWNGNDSGRIVDLKARLRDPHLSSRERLLVSIVQRLSNVRDACIATMSHSQSSHVTERYELSPTSEMVYRRESERNPRVNNVRGEDRQAYYLIYFFLNINQ